jgi:hypothetical protein
MINLADPSMSLLAASGGDTVKLFDVSVEPGDPCTLNYTPTPGCVVNSVKWNHASESITHPLFTLSLFSFTFNLQVPFFSVSCRVFSSLESAFPGVWINWGLFGCFFFLKKTQF